MKTIGLIGGMSWESTQVYYRLLNQQIQAALGGHASAKLVLYSVDFAEIERLQHSGDWAATAVILADAARALERAGADFIVICTNTMHKVADEVAAAVRIPLLHIVDVVAERLKRVGIDLVGLLGTQFTMEQDFYRQLLEQQGIRVLVPELPERQQIHRIIFDELCHGQCNPQSKTTYLSIIDGLARAGAQGVILGCTEIGMLINGSDTTVPLYDTTTIHVDAIVAAALAN
ncbi:aspartate/glutamate racemase [Pseudidiomarina aestuarii]|uniref:Aspartate/glutamate racemase n=1 Tax=Pseudidiomarina aestuarii TaxID=624146 RepID=A0A2T4CNF3_9GAMM|nr:aspartate/glutamate racemase [Pseudidiomarina aestuarii]PTB85400.1 aspartate/glutamate racemase [Pseudidiomarina aestuarii]PTB88446.1 aspartate/glutamate racemase [Pseudidiomarina aestuarii]